MRLRVTDHALIQFLRRAGGMDIEALRQRLQASLERAARAAERLDAGEYRIIADGLKYRIANGSVVTVVDPHDRFEGRGR